MKSRGQLTIVVIIAIAIGAVAWAWWSKYTSMDQAMAYYGTAHAKRIRFAKSVELWDLAPSDSNSDEATIEIDGLSWHRTELYDASEWQGMLHARFCLTQDASYSWEGDVTSAAGSESWQKVLLFRDESGETRIAIDFASARLKLLPQGDSISIRPSIDGLRIVLDR